MASPLVLQFGTSRFLQAHVDYFVAKSIESGLSSTPIAVVQTSSSLSGKKRVKAFNEIDYYPVRIQGLEFGESVDRTEWVGSVECAFEADQSWAEITELFCQRVTHVVSNTADNGYELSDSDQIDQQPPTSFPAKLTALLHARFSRQGTGVTIMPCELVAENGQRLKRAVASVAQTWRLSDEFLHWMDEECLWVNSLVDRIVSSALEPLGAVTEPYALWAIENQPGLTVPCEHKAIRVVDDLAPLEWLKLGVLNLSHTYLVDRWLERDALNTETVFQAMHDTRLRSELEDVLTEEVIPILQSMRLGEDVEGYVEAVRERFLNPFLEHRLSDIAQNHASKVERRILPVWQQRNGLDCPRLFACLRRHHLTSE
ncbi:mannitol dehydrogenase family protein [Natronospirillum operosum]|uniref:Mannitol dehydrogenase family protein n=1 Tax=Natronospirillum operosum TaxID=2759953 RepID=A0A4Z0WEQ0_9GAMM|nr:mannitol dehydrogenase family protein [Natronospirillum operosum]TGG93411.1 mannitol dehydrogenase family protein [Natronospirillum operosum]